MMTELEHKTLENRIRVLDDLEKILHAVESECFVAQCVPILDDEEHADLIQGYADRVHEIWLDMEELGSVKRRRAILNET